MRLLALTSYQISEKIIVNSFEIIYSAGGIKFIKCSKFAENCLFSRRNQVLKMFQIKQKYVSVSADQVRLFRNFQF